MNILIVEVLYMYNEDLDAEYEYERNQYVIDTDKIDAFASTDDANWWYTEDICKAALRLKEDTAINGYVTVGKKSTFRDTNFEYEIFKADTDNFEKTVLVESYLC